ncbi:AAA family ATPase [Pantoea trifolii]|uniref:ATP-binding protein n=1 Tax=Pantoea trifolii TaxID=2968030 RepID=A0ABT1VQD3_9GAMM|nr:MULTISPECIES: AAA family ATPase [unclassified Pantoea]MCQ8229113.1 ATP-binding protein [Pantoea sp. MMK2]MCQ8237287.1 ATP-binding protein [Pantoea sp. MMK3]
MKLTVDNFGIIKKAEVEIGGLTVITGENDTGKSTVGKILFSLVKAFARYREDLEESKDVTILSYLEEIYFALRRVVNITHEIDVRDFFQPRRLQNQLRLEYRMAKDEALFVLENARSRGIEIPNEIFSLVENNFTKIEYVLNEPEDKKGAINRAIKKAFYSEFKSEILQKGGDVQNAATISIKDGASDIIDISLNRDGSIRYQANEDLGFSDATYVDSPAIIQFNNMVRTSKTLFDDTSSNRLSVPLHLKDLSSKLSDSMYGFFEFEMFLDDSEMAVLSKRINGLLDGSVDYDLDKKDFVFNRDGISISSTNIASGIKAIGMLDLLIKGGNTKKNSLLLLDEPEVNLHPKWQVVYCEIVTTLVSCGVDLIITTHSPYIVHALKEFSVQKGIKHQFYLAHKKDDLKFSQFSNISENISYAIDLLAAPMHELNKKSVDDVFSKSNFDDME